MRAVISLASLMRERLSGLAPMEPFPAYTLGRARLWGQAPLEVRVLSFGPGGAVVSTPGGHEDFLPLEEVFVSLEVVLSWVPNRIALPWREQWRERVRRAFERYGLSQSI